MLITALTGGIATGKTVVARRLEEHGCFVYSADQAAHRLMSPGTPAWQAIVKRFSPTILDLEGNVDRARLGRLVFSRNDDRRFLNHLLHPLVEADKTALVRKLEAQRRFRIFISEAALTIEAGFIGRFHRTVVTHCPTSMQLERLCRRDGIEREAALLRIRSQLPGRERLRYADYIIDTSGNLEKTLLQTDRVYSCLEIDFKTIG